MTDSLLTIVADEILKLFQPIRTVVDNPALLDDLLAEIGASADTAGGDTLASALGAVVDLSNQLDQLASAPAPSFEEIANVLEASGKALNAVRALSDAGGPAAQLETFGQDLVDFLLSAYITAWHPLVRAIAVLLTVLDPAETEDLQPAIVDDGGNVVRLPFRLGRFHLDRLSALLQHPEATLRAAYGNDLQTVDDANAMADKLFPRLLAVLRALEIRCRYGFTPGDEALLGDAAPLVDHALIIYAADKLLGADAEAGVVLTLSSADRGDLGLLVTPFGTLQLKTQAGAWAIELDLTADVQAFAYGRHGATIVASVATAEVDGKFTATLAAPTDGGPAFVLGSPNGSRLEVGGALFTAATSLTEARQTFALSGEVSKSAIVIVPGDGDGFLGSVLPKDGLQATFDLGMAWSNESGLTFKGAAGLDATIVVGLSIGNVITIPTVHLGLQASDAGLVAEVSVSVGVLIGPVQAVADRVGIAGDITFPQAGGNLGAADLALSFKPPSGIGLAVDAGGVSGGGFLEHDEAKHQYTGVLQLEFTDLALQAFGLITTQVANGDGYSLLALVDADFPPVQLGWGFTLNGVGGLLAVHRAASVDALRAALKADKLSTILFPKNAITNAPQILAELDTLFPTAPGRFLFGPMALIGWGTPTVLTAALAVIVELPEPVRIILLARLAVRLPTESDAQVRINMDALGVLDLGQNSLSLDATLFDSRLLQYPLSGDMALRATWSGQREFLLSVGGFHPRFTPPAGFPALKRLTIDMPSGSIATLRLETYLAITSNTLQIGANLHLVVKVSAFSVDGHLGFDALFQRDPFHFDGDISGSVTISIDGDDLLSVSLDATLTGPAPWHVSGNFKVHIIFVDIHKSFSATWGDDAPADQIAAVDVGALLAAAFADPRSWGAQLADGTPALVSARDLQSAGGVVAHPLARLEVHERTAPLGLDITRLGGAPLSGTNHFAITDFRIGGTRVPHESLQDDFAPGEFFDMSDDDKLAQPSFERHDAGVRLSGGLVTSGSPVAKDITYETYFVDEVGGEPRTDPGTPAQKWSLADLLAVLSTGSAARAPMMSAGNRRYTAPGRPIRVAEPAFVLVDADTLAPSGIGSANGGAYSDVRALLNQELNRVPSQQGHLQIVATHEMMAAHG